MTSTDLITDSGGTFDVPMTVPGRLTEEEFVAWCHPEVRAEWVDGQVEIMSPASIPHVRLSSWLVALLTQFAEHHDLGMVLGPEAQIRFAGMRRRRVPDISFVAKGRIGIVRENHIEGPPDLIVEIVSPDSVARDWREKYLEYEAAGVLEYWVIDLSAERAEFYALSAEGDRPAYQRLEEANGIIQSRVLPNLHMTTKWLWPTTRPKVAEALRALGVHSS